MQLKNKFDLKLNLILKLIFTMVFENVSPNINYPMIIDYMALCTNNRESTSNNYNACVFCQKFGFQEPIEIFIDENTATCPHCGLDTVISVSEIPGWDGTYISEIEYAQKKLRILSGLYGLLKPLDIIQPYRLEMGTNVQKIFDNSLYGFWEHEITKSLNNELEINKSNFLLNLSSNEYFKCINSKDINVDIISVKFLINKDGDLKQIGMLSKKCRGAMARFVLKNKITNYKDIKDFNDYGYSFYKKDKNTITFVKD